MIRLVLAQLLKCILCTYCSGNIPFYHINNPIISNAAFYTIEFFPRLFACSAICYKIEPVSIIMREKQIAIIGTNGLYV